MTTQAEALNNAAEILNRARYITGPESRAELLQAANAVLTEVCYHLDHLTGINPNYLEAMRNSMNLGRVYEPIPTSAELVLTTAVQETIDQEVRAADAHS